MEYIKTYEGFFDIFKRKVSEDDAIINDYIKRLKRIKGISPYDITLDTEGTEEGEQYHYRYRVEFEDTPLKILKSESDHKYRRGWNDDTVKRCIDAGGIRQDYWTFYRIAVDVMGEDVIIKTSAKKAKELFELIADVYIKDKEARRIQKIRNEMNPAADKLDPDIYPENNK